MSAASPANQTPGAWPYLRASIAAHPLWWLIGSLLVLRTFFVLLSPVDLIADESYYWDWSRRLDYGYYSKPPMIAWVNWLSTGLLGTSEFGVRMPAVLFGTLGLLWIYALGAKLYSYRVGLIAALLLALTPGQTAMSFLMTIDAPFLFFWTGALYCFWMMISSEKPSLRWCLGTAVCLGLGVLSKQTMLGFFPLAGLFLLLTPAYRNKLFSGQLWLTALLGLSFLAPVIYWNAQHDWITLQHTASHFNDASETLWRQFVRFLEFVAGQMGVVSPVLWVAVLFSLIASAKQFKKLSAEERYLFCFSAVPLFAVFALSATRKLEPNWPAAFYPAAIILTTGVLLGRASVSGVFSDRNKTLKRTWQTGLVCTVLTYAAITVVPASPLAGSPLDITCRLRGWESLSEQFRSILQNESHEDLSDSMIITTAGRDITSALAFYLPENPLVAYWSNDDGQILCQYDMWDRPDVSQVPHAYVVTYETPNMPDSLKNSFQSWSSLGTIAVELGGGRKREYRVYKTSHLSPDKQYERAFNAVAREPFPTTNPIK